LEFFGAVANLMGPTYSLKKTPWPWIINYFYRWLF